MKTQSHKLAIILTTVGICLLSVSAWAAVAGKISGTVTDSKGRSPLIGATVQVVGTDYVTKTDEDGEYFIINVPVGKYDIAVTHVGFEAITKKEVRVLVDLTTPVDFSLAEMAVELKKEVVVYATAPVVQRDLTSSRVIFTADRLKNLPNIQSIQSVLTNYPGVVVDQNLDLHVRGGRSGQISYYYDGFSVQDPFVADAGIRIMPTALEELSLTSGGFTAEYGEAMSGVVNAVSREGGSSYHGGLKMFDGATQPYNVNTGEWGGLKRVGNRSMSFNVSGPVPGFSEKRFTFFSAGEYYRNINYLPHDWSITYTGTTKLSYHASNRLKIKGNFTYSRSNGATYDHRDVNGLSFDLNLNGLPINKKEGFLGGLSGTYAFSERMVWSLQYNRFSTWTKSAPEHLFNTYWRDWPGYSEDSTGEYNGTIHLHNYTNQLDNSNPYELVGFAMGDRFNPTYSYRKSIYNSITSNMVGQIGKAHQLKAGFEWRKYNVDRDFKQFYNSRPYSEVYHIQPLYISTFVQDKIEYADFVINAGIRHDYRDPDATYNTAPGNRTPVWKKASAKSRFAPRIGVSFPIAVNSVMHFNYGIYYQMPIYKYLYFNLEGDVNSGFPLLGNPDLAPERTASYELGFNHLFGENLRTDITAYYKDISDLVSTRPVFRVAGNEVTRFVNADYGTVVGFDVALEKLPKNGFLSGSLSYGFMMARGIGSTAMEPYYTYITATEDTLAPVKEYPLDFDQRHTLTGVLDYRVPENWKGSVFGLMIPGNWGLNLVGYVGSGLPYSKSDSKGNRTGDRNAFRLPAYYSVDMRFNKDFQMGKTGSLLTYFIEVDNLFDRRNVLAVYQYTGLPSDDGVEVGTGLALSQTDLARANRLYDQDPQNYSPPRTIRTGIELHF